MHTATSFDPRHDAIAAASALLSDNTYRDELAPLVRIKTESQNPERRENLYEYLRNGVSPMLIDLGFDVEVFDNPLAGGGPLLVGERHEGDDLPTVLSYGHGDVVDGLAGRWSAGREPYVLSETADRLYGRGTADNKGQHLANLMALRTVIEGRNGKLGYNLKYLIETSEEVAAIGLHEFVLAHRDRLDADVLIASDGPRVAPDVPTVFLGSRGAMSFTLTVDLRNEAHHSGNWGGFIADPAIVLANAIAAISGPDGRINVPAWRPAEPDPALRLALDGCPFDAGDSGDQPDDWWGEPGLTVWERTALWPSFSVLAFDHGNPDNPVNAIHPSSTAYCGLRYPDTIDPEIILPSLQQFLDERGLNRVRVSLEPSTHLRATCGQPDGRWPRFVSESIQRTLGRAPQVLPSNGGSLPNDVFTDLLGVDTVWIPHSYNSCCQHAPDEHILKDVVDEALKLMAGIWWDLGEATLVPTGTGR